jgi:rhodanese-related sulfurtransferase
MTTSQIVLYAVLGLVILIYLRRFLVTRKVPRYSATQLADRIKDPSFVLLDVRTAGERQARLIKGSLHIPLQELPKRIEELEKYRSREVICYCQSGNRSMVAAVRLRRQGFNAASLDGGIAEWEFVSKTSNRK